MKIKESALEEFKNKFNIIALRYYRNTLLVIVKGNKIPYRKITDFVFFDCNVSSDLNVTILNEDELQLAMKTNSDFKTLYNYGDILL